MKKFTSFGDESSRSVQVWLSEEAFSTWGFGVMCAERAGNFLRPLACRCVEAWHRVAAAAPAGAHPYRPAHR
eukprot:2413326-Amphidinium_carterae.1